MGSAFQQTTPIRTAQALLSRRVARRRELVTSTRLRALVVETAAVATVVAATSEVATAALAVTARVVALAYNLARKAHDIGQCVGCVLRQWGRIDLDGVPCGRSSSLLTFPLAADARAATAATEDRCWAAAAHHPSWLVSISGYSSSSRNRGREPLLVF